MLRDRDEPEPPQPFGGRYVVIRPDGDQYSVAVNPPLPSGDGDPRTYGSKHEAFGAARDLWTQHRLPCLDLTEGQVRGHHED